MRQRRPKLSNLRLRNASSFKPVHAAGRILINNILPPVAAWRAQAVKGLRGRYAGNNLTLTK